MEGLLKQLQQHVGDNRKINSHGSKKASEQFHTEGFALNSLHHNGAGEHQENGDGIIHAASPSNIGSSISSCSIFDLADEITDEAVKAATHKFHPSYGNPSHLVFRVLPKDKKARPSVAPPTSDYLDAALKIGRDNATHLDSAEIIQSQGAYHTKKQITSWTDQQIQQAISDSVEIAPTQYFNEDDAAFEENVHYNGSAR